MNCAFCGQDPDLIVLTRLRPEAPGVSPGRKGEAGAPRSPEGEVGLASDGFRPSPPGEALRGATGVSPWGSTWRPDGSEQVQACRDCAIANGVYCTRHEKPHTGCSGRDGKGTICWNCVDAAMLKNVGQAEFFTKRLREGLPKPEQDRIRRWVDDMEAPWSHLDRAAIMLRGLLLEAHRRRATPREVVDDMIEQRSADAMLPFAY